MSRRRPCTCGQEWAAHGLGDAVRQLRASRQTIKHHVDTLQLGTVHHARVHLSTADLEALQERLSALRRTQRRRRLARVGITSF